MKCANIISILEEIMPYNLAMDWDNVGLLVGSSEKEVKKVLLGLDLTEDMLDFALKERVDFIITHHPLIFSGIKAVNNNTSLGRKILKLIANDISYMAMHTNYDIAPNCMCKASFNRLGIDFDEILEETATFNGNIVGVGGIASLKEKKNLKDVANLVKEKFELSNLVIYGDLEEKFDKIAISPGSGKGMYREAIKKDVKLLITGDITHHEGLDALEAGVSIIDAGHYGIEKVFIDDMKEKLENISKELEILKYYKDERKFI